MRLLFLFTKCRTEITFRLFINALKHIAGELTGSNFCIFVDEDSNTVYEIFCKWIRSLSKAAEDEAVKESKKTGNELQEAVKHELIISKRGHLLKIQS